MSSLESKLIRPLARVAALIGALALAACGPSRDPVPEPAAPATPAPAAEAAPAGPATVAFLAPVSAGDAGLAAIGQALVNASTLALEDLADPGLRLTVYDTGGDAARAGQAAQRAIAEGADLIVGPLLAGGVRAVRPEAQAAGIKVIAFSTDASVAGDPVYLAGFLPEWEAERVLGFAASQDRRRVAVFAPANAYGAAAVKGADKAAARGAVSVVSVARYEPSFNGIQDAAQGFVGDATAVGADALLLPAGGQELQAVGSFMNYFDLDPRDVQYLGLGQWNSGASFQEPALQGGWFPGPDPARLGGFVRRYEAAFGAKPPSVLAALGYDAVWAAGDLLRTGRAEGRAPFAGPEITRGQGFEGALGAFRFLPDGTNQRAIAILAVGARDFQVVDPAPGALTAGPGS